VVGERWRVGSVVAEVTAPRMPCRTFAGFWDVPRLVRRFTAAARPGAYLKVVEEGVL
jgi:MOSC domain-containing protein YiiM